MATEWISRDCIVTALDMCAVLAHYDIRAGRGTSFRIHCPFHEDDRPSCSVNPQAKVFNCFGCGEQGNVLDFIAGMEDLDPKTEFRAVLEKAIDIIGNNPTPQKSAQRSARKISANKTKAGRSAAPKPTSIADDGEIHGDANEGDKSATEATAPKKNKKHSKRPNLNEPDGSLELQPNRVLEGPAFPLKLQQKHPWLDEQLKRIGVNRSVAQEFGIGFEGRSNALMANRICFPIHNGDDDLVAYAGRWASDDADEQGRFFTQNGREQPRYRLPKGFHKQLELFNWHRVLEQFQDTSIVVLVEGFWSVLRLQAMTIPSVALMGLTISDAQIRLLSEGGIRSVIVMLDGDEQGQAAMESIVPKLSSHFFTRSIILPDSAKPDDVETSVLNEVKTLCTDADIASTETKREEKERSKPLQKLKGQSAAKRKPSNRTRKAKGNGAAKASSGRGSKANPTSPDQNYALPTSSVSASFGWTSVD